MNMRAGRCERMDGAKSCSRAQRLQPASWWSLGKASSKLWPCPALESRKWMRGGHGRDTVRGALSDDLGLLRSARSSDISSRAAEETNLPRARHKWTGGGLGEVEGFAETPGYRKITPEKNSNAIRHRRDRDEHWRKAWRKGVGELQRRGEDNQKRERRNKV